jgi:predicted amidohydrolase
MQLTIATCQFPTSSGIENNYKYVSDLMQQAKERGADVAHFSEACLSGYAGADIENCEGLDWELLQACTQDLINLAGKLELWLILGSTHRLGGHHKPHNSLYMINHQGVLIDRYDKRFCAGDASEQTGDLKHYAPGNHFSVFEINGIRCGALICHDYHYPELYRAYKRRGVQVMFHSYHAAHISPQKLEMMQQQVGSENYAFNPGTTYPEITMPATMIASAASNHVWISCPNSAARESCFGSFFVRADGVITGQLERHETNILISEVDTEKRLYDSTRHWRDRALAGILHSGKQVNAARSKCRNPLIKSEDSGIRHRTAEPE